MNVLKSKIISLVIISTLCVNSLFANNTYAAEIKIEKDKFNQKGITNDTYSYMQWAFNNEGKDIYEGVKAVKDVDIDMDKAIELIEGKQKREVVVAVIDIGVDINHEDLEGKIWINKDEIPGNGIDDDKNGFVDDVYGWNFFDGNNNISNINYDTYNNNYVMEHGTHVAATIAGISDNNKGIAGVAGKVDVKIMPIKILGGPFGTTNISDAFTSNMVKAIKYAQDNGADIVNMSFGGVYVDITEMTLIKNSKMLFIAAAGNDGLNNDEVRTSPASYGFNNIISVANINCSGQLYSSNYGKNTVDIAAPGTSIYSGIPNNKYKMLTGTSMATPMVTGIATLLYALDKDMTAIKAKRIILGSAKQLDTLDEYVKTDGMASAYNALTYNYDIPYIEKYINDIKKSNKKNVVLNISDYVDKIKQVKYTYGDKKADYFQNEKNGIELSLKQLEDVYTTSFIADKSGIYTIYAVDTNGNEKIRKININILELEKINMWFNKKTIYVGDYLYLNPSISPSNIYTTYSYKSSNKNVVKVNKEGKVTAVGKGKALVTIKTDNGVTTKCNIVVKQ